MIVMQLDVYSNNNNNNAPITLDRIRENIRA